jgi:lysophospholipase L1-like esterase
MKKITILLFIAMLSFNISDLFAQSHEFAMIDAYAEQNKQLGEPKKGERRVVFMGNSITWNWVAQRGDFFKKNNLIGRGISGQTSYQFLLRFRQDVINLKPKVVVINYGTNDIAENTGAYSEEHTFNNVKAMCDLARYHKIKVVLASTLPHKGFGWNPNIKDAMQKIRSLNARVKNYAKENKITYVDYFSAMLNSDGSGMREDLSQDGVHPNAKGYEIMEALILPIVNKLR